MEHGEGFTRARHASRSRNKVSTTNDHAHITGRTSRSRSANLGGATKRKPHQQSYRIRSRRELRSSTGPARLKTKAKFKIREIALAYTTSRACMLLLAAATLASCLFFILGTYLGDRSWVHYLESAFGVLFLIDYLLSLAAAPVPRAYALSVGGMTDLISCLPAFGAFQPWMTSLAFVRYLRVGKAIRVMRNHQLLSNVFSNDDVSIKATLLIVKVVGVVLMTSAILFGVERGLRDDEGTGAFNEPGWQWHDALYFTVVTLSTVGYGDILPLKTVSRLLMVAVIVFALTYFSIEINQLVDAIHSRPKHRKGFARSLIGKQKHVILAMPGGAAHGGSADGSGENEFDCDTLERCLEEFFHEENDATRVMVWVIVMSPCLPTEDIATLCQSPKYHSRVVYFRGSVTSPKDMAAVCAEYSDCIFLFPISHAHGNYTREMEERTHLAAKAVRRYLDRTPTDNELMAKAKLLSHNGQLRRTVVTVDDLHSKYQLLGFGIDHVICHDELKMSMLASATLYPAFLPLVANCVRSCSGPQEGTSRRGGGSNAGLSGEEEMYGYGGVYSTRRDGLFSTSNRWSQRRGSFWGRGQGSQGVKLGRPQENVRVDEIVNDGMSESSENLNEDWVDDYSMGTLFEMHSIPLEVISAESRLWSMSFSRAARAMYDVSDGKVLLLAAVEPVTDNTGNNDASNNLLDMSGHRFRKTRRGTSGGRGAGVAAARQWRRRSNLAAEASTEVEVEVFPEDKFRFTIESHVMVLAETQTIAEDFFFTFEENHEDGSIPSYSSHHSVPRAAAGTSTEDKTKRRPTAGTDSATAPAAPMNASIASSIPITEPTTSIDESNDGAAYPYSDISPAAAAGLVKTASSSRIHDTIEEEQEEEPRRQAKDERDGIASPASNDDGSNSLVTVAPPVAMATKVREGLNNILGVGTGIGNTAGGSSRPTSSGTGGSSPTPKGVGGKGRRKGGGGGGESTSRGSMSRMSSNLGWKINEETREQLDDIQKEIFEEDEVDWTLALEALNRARTQLRDLDEEAVTDGDHDSAMFFDKVGAVSDSIADALRFHTASTPADLTGHIVIIGGHARLQHYVIALRRQRPNKAIVVVTEDKEMFFELRDRLVEFKCFEMSLNITKIYHVFGMTQDSFTLQEARVKQAESVVLMSDRPDDTAVLLGSFEMEQVMDEIPSKYHRPKVLIDLSKDSSICYVGLAIGGMTDVGQPLACARFDDQDKPVREGGAENLRSWPLFAAGCVWTTSIMDVFAVRTYFNAHVLSFFETLLLLQPGGLSTSDQQNSTRLQREQRLQQLLPRVQRSGLGADQEEKGVESEAKDGERHEGVGNGRGQIGQGVANRLYGSASGGGVESNNNNGTRKDGVRSGAAVIDNHDNTSNTADSGDSMANPRRCQFAHLRVSASFAGKTYGDLTRHLISAGAMPLGLYRPAGTKGSMIAYTHINPLPNEPLIAWPAASHGDDGSTPRYFDESVGDDDKEEEEDDKGWRKGFVWSWGGQGGGGSGGGDGGHAGDAKPFGQPQQSQSRESTTGYKAWRGDDVFVVRSKACVLCGDVSYP